MTKYPLLQSGFIGTVAADFMVPAAKIPGLADMALLKNHLNPGSNLFYSPMIEKLYRRFYKDPATMREMAFREEIIRASGILFGNGSFLNWIRTQNKSTTIGSLHRVFLMETLGFLIGHPRDLHISQWANLLRADEKSKSVTVDVDKYFNIVDRRERYAELPPDMASIISIWLEKSQGYTDLLTTLYVIFGPKGDDSVVGGVRGPAP